MVSGIKLRVDMMGSMFLDISYIDTNGLKSELDSCYAVPAWDVEIVLTKCNIHPLTAMRSPGHTQVGVCDCANDALYYHLIPVQGANDGNTTRW